jgi:Na+/H+ antiporter NhaC
MTDPSPTDATARDTAKVQLAYKIILFFASMVLGALLWITLNRPMQKLQTAAANNTNSTAAAEGQAYMFQIWEALPLVFVALAGFGLLVAATREI